MTVAERYERMMSVQHGYRKGRRCECGFVPLNGSLSGLSNHIYGWQRKQQEAARLGEVFTHV